MPIESLARKFRPAGFDQPEGSRQNYVKPRPELQEAFYQWIRELPVGSPDGRDMEKDYGRACELIKPLGEIPYKEANSLLVDFFPKPYGYGEAGLFISACYNQASEQVILFDLDRPDKDSMGYRLGKNKVLVNNGRTGWWFGHNSLGFIVNNRECSRNSAESSSGIVLNNGKTSYGFREKSSGITLDNGLTGILISLREPESYGYDLSKARVLKPADLERMPELKIYLEELSEITKAIKDEKSAKRFLERYGPEPKGRIEQEILRLIESE